MLKKKPRKLFAIFLLVNILVVLLGCRNITIRVNKTLFGLSENWKVVYEIEGKVKYSKDDSNDYTFTVGENTKLVIEYIGDSDDLVQSEFITIRRLFASDIKLRTDSLDHKTGRITYIEQPDADALMLFAQNNGYIILLELGEGEISSEFVILR